MVQTGFLSLDVTSSPDLFVCSIGHSFTAEHLYVVGFLPDLTGQTAKRVREAHRVLGQLPSDFSRKTVCIVEMHLVQ